MLSKPCKFGAVIFLCHCVIMIQVFIRTGLYFRKSTLKCFVTSKFDVDKKCLIPILSLLVKSVYYVCFS